MFNSILRWSILRFVFRKIKRRTSYTPSSLLTRSTLLLVYSLGLYRRRKYWGTRREEVTNTETQTQRYFVGRILLSLSLHGMDRDIGNENHRLRSILEGTDGWLPSVLRTTVLYPLPRHSSTKAPVGTVESEVVTTEVLKRNPFRIPRSTSLDQPSWSYD